MNELEKLEYTKSFVDKLANGINPIDDEPIPKDDLLNNVRISRCMFFVSDILRRVIENGGVQKSKKTSKIQFSITLEQLAKYDFEGRPISASEISKKIYALVENEEMDKITYKDITSWLIRIGMLCEKFDENGKTKKYPTFEGEKLGISLEQRMGRGGEYDVVLYDKNAQKFLLDNLEGVLSLKYTTEL